MNNRGEIAGGFWDNSGNWTPVLWKPLNKQRGAYGSPIILKGPDGYADGGWADGINDLGDISGVMWGSEGLRPCCGVLTIWSSPKP